MNSTAHVQEASTGAWANYQNLSTWDLVMPPFSPDQICFGLNRQLDIQSFSCFLQLIGRPEFADTLASRLSSTEIDAFVNQFTGILKKHCSEDEYHRLFLNRDQPAHHHAPDRSHS